MIYLQLTNYLFKTNYKCKVLNDGLKKKSDVIDDPN